MTFDELTLYLENETNQFDHAFKQIVAFSEASYNEYKTNLKQAELKVVQESGTTEDIIYLESEAKGGFIDRSKKIINKIVNSFIEWIKNISKSIKEFFYGKETKSTFDKAGKLAKDDPKLKSKKIDIEDIEKIIENCDKHNAEIDRQLAKFKANSFSDNDMKNLDSTMESFEKNNEKKKKRRKAIVLWALMAIVTKSVFDIMEIQHREAEELQKAADSINAGYFDTPEDMEKYVAAINYKVAINKEKANCMQNFIKDGVRKTKETMRTVSRINEPKIPENQYGNWPGAVDNKLSDEEVEQRNRMREKLKNESVNEDNYLDSLLDEVQESVVVDEAFNAEQYLTVIESEIDIANQHLYDLNMESSDESDTMEEYLAMMEKEIDGFSEAEYGYESDESITAEEYLESLEDALFGYDEEVEESVSAEDYLDLLESKIFR